MESAFVSPLLLVTVGVAATTIFIVYRLLVSPYRLLSSYGFKGPPPLPVFGNYLSIKKEGHNQFLEQQLKKYGPVIGYYVGAAPRIAVADVELAKEILVKEFDSFTDRGFQGGPTIGLKALRLAPGLFLSNGETWKTARKTLTPSFSAMKMKLMVPLLKRSSDVLLERLKEFCESGKSMETFKVYGAFSMETLIATAFGRYVDIQRGEADQLTKAASSLFRANEEGSPTASDLLTLLMSNFPWLEPLMCMAFRNTRVADSGILMHKTALGLIKARMESKEPPKIKDFLQLMIDATEGENGDSAANRLTTKQIVGFSLDFLFAGYETTANTLSYTSYLLAMNTDVQEKLQAEIDGYFDEDPEASLYEAAQKLKYLDKVIQESLRLYTPFPKTQRHCSRTVTIGNVTIPKGAGIVIPIDVIHHMPQYWPDPYRFDPERFTPEAKASRPQLAHIPFGWGPRNCIGMRFALLETKIALMEILRKYSFARGPETPAKLQLIFGLTTTPKGGVFIKIVPRA